MPMNIDIADLISKFQAALPQDTAASDGKRKVEIDLHVQGSITTTETTLEPRLAFRAPSGPSRKAAK
jgi:hypothetical protein